MARYKGLQVGINEWSSLSLHMCLMQDPLSQQKSRLAASHQLQVLFRDFDDEEAWIKEKEPVASLPNKGM